MSLAIYAAGRRKDQTIQKSLKSELKLNIFIEQWKQSTFYRYCNNFYSYNFSNKLYNSHESNSIEICLYYFELAQELWG